MSQGLRRVGSTRSAEAAPSPPRTLLLIARNADDARALRAFLSDTGVSCHYSERFELDALRTATFEAILVFGNEIPMAEFVAGAVALHAWRPALPLVLLCERATQLALLDAFDETRMPPAILSATAPATTVWDALCLVSEAARHQQHHPGAGPNLRLGDIETARELFVRMFEGRAPANDLHFDRFLPSALRQASSQYWTPIDVILRAVSWLQELGLESVVDVGSGVGKFCVVGAVVSGCSFAGIERRPHLSGIARRLSRAFGVEERVSIVDATFGEATLPCADCYYFFNPFEENLLPTEEMLDTSVELTPERFRRELRAFRGLVATLPLGTHVLTYNGVGGRIPPSLEERRVDRELPTVLRLLQKVRH